MADTVNNDTTQTAQTTEAPIVDTSVPATATETAIGSTLDRLDEAHGINKAPAKTDTAQTTTTGAVVKPADGTAGAGGGTNADGTPVKPPTAKGAVRTKDDGQGNLVNAATGEMVAKAGSERRLYTELQQSRRELTNAQQQLQQAAALQQQVQTLTAQLDTLQASNNVAQQFGLTPDQNIMGAKLMALYNKNPLECLKYILTEAAAAGHDISKVTGQGHIDTAAIARLVDERLRPFTQQNEAQRVHDQAVQEATVEYENFVTAYPDAVQHETEIAKLMVKGQMQPREAYFALKSWTHEQGYDWNTPLRAQIEARKNGTTVQVIPPAHGGAPIPSGRGASTTLAPTVSGTRAPETMSNRDIVRDAMKSAGLTV